METKRVVVKCFVFVGAIEYQAWEVPVSWTEDELQDFAWQRAVEYAEMYGVYSPGEPEDWDNDEEYYEACYLWEQVSGHAMPYIQDKHDAHLTYGYNSEVQWNRA